MNINSYVFVYSFYQLNTNSLLFFHSVKWLPIKGLTIFQSIKNKANNIKRYITYKINKICIKVLNNTYFVTKILFYNDI